MKHGAPADKVDLDSNFGAPARKADLNLDWASGVLLLLVLGLTVGTELSAASTPGLLEPDWQGGTDGALTAVPARQRRGAEAVAPLAGSGPPRGLMIALGLGPKAAVAAAHGSLAMND